MTVMPDATAKRQTTLVPWVSTYLHATLHRTPDRAPHNPFRRRVPSN